MKKVKKIFIKGGRKNEYNLYKTRRLFNTKFKIKREKSVKLGRYAKLRLKFIKYEMKPFYQKLLMEDKLTEYLFEIEAKANEMEINLMNCMKKQLKIDEELKEKDQMKWVQMMNNITNSTQEMVLNKIIYSYRTN